MGFEAKVLAKVEEVLGDVYAKFFECTMFVECSLEDAEMLRDVLVTEFSTRILLASYRDEVAFDFV